MLDPALQHYLQQAKAASMTLDEVTAELVSAGWSSEQVLEAQGLYGGHPATQPILATAPSQQTYTDQTTTPTKKFKLALHWNWKVASIAIAALLFLLVSGTGIYAYLLAADKVSSNNEFIEKTADTIALTVPFFPKTPKIVLQRAMLSHQTVTQNSLDFSLVATSNDFENIVGANELDIQLVGYTDFTDQKNPKMSLTGHVTKDFSFEIRKNDPILYFKITKLPSLLLSMMGMDAASLEPVIANWISYDTTPLETEARKSLDELDTESNDKDVVGTMAEKMLNEDILPALVMNKEDLDGVKTYRINFQPSPVLLDRLSEELDEQLTSSNNRHYAQVLGASTTYLAEEPKVSDVIKDLSITMWVDTKDYYVRKSTISFNIQPPEVDQSAGPTLDYLPLPTMTNQPVTVVAVLKLGNFGETLLIEVPETSITLDEFYQKISDVMFGGSFNARNPSSPQANNAMRSNDVSQILNAIIRYRAFNNELPAGITTTNQEISSVGANICSSLLAEELKRLPTDPLSSHGGTEISDCNGNYSTGYFISVDASNKVTVSAPLAELGETISLTD